MLEKFNASQKRNNLELINLQLILITFKIGMILMLHDSGDVLDLLT